MKSSIFCQRGFTLIELLVVISIIGLLAALILTNIAGTRDRGYDNKKAISYS
jgi:prepilin-type N-terminal cleavage/methylation domain-containing protein